MYAVKLDFKSTELFWNLVRIPFHYSILMDNQSRLKPLLVIKLRLNNNEQMNLYQLINQSESDSI